MKGSKVIGTFNTFLLLGLLTGAAQAQTVEYFHTDELGSVVAVSNVAGLVIERREYEPYGSQLTPAVKNGPGFTGHVQDALTGLAYMQQRYYDPLVGLFLSVDPVSAYENPVRNLNRFRYANNNPYKFVDPDGREVVIRLNGATPKEAVQVVGHLNKSATMRVEMGRIVDSRETYTMSFNRGGDTSYDHGNRQINIDVGSGLKIRSSGEVQSPALGGGHEISHAAQHDRLGTESFVANLEVPVISSELKDGGLSVTYGTSVEESRATGVESRAAKELGEPSRNNYHDAAGAVNTCAPNSGREC